MTISDLSSRFFGKTVRDYTGEVSAPSEPDVVYRLSLDYDDTRSMADLLTEFLGQVDASALQALVIGAWEEPHETSADGVIAALVAQAPRLSGLKALFIGDITYEQCEISWIVQGDYGPLLAAFPQLEMLQLRGSTSLTLPAFQHAALKRLVIESGGLPSEVLQALAASSLPALEQLELWLGTSDYGFDGDLALVQRVVNELRSPALLALGLRDSEIADQLATWLAGEAWIGSLETLDLSLGTLGDAGAQALLASPYAASLGRLDLSHHYISEALQQQLTAALPGVVLDDAQDPDDDDDRYVAVGE